MANILASPSGGPQPVGGAEAVTLTLQRAIDKAQPGDTVRLVLDNASDTAANIHYHGLAVTPLELTLMQRSPARHAVVPVHVMPVVLDPADAQ